LIGSDKHRTKQWSGWLSNLVPSLHRYISVDGGTGAHLLAHLAGHDPSLQQVFSPRHANLLLVVTPLSQKLAPAVVAMASALAQPAHVLLLGSTQNLSGMFPSEAFASAEQLFPDAASVSGDSLDDILRAARSSSEARSGSAVIDADEPTAPIFSLPPREELEMATELAVLSLGPVQSCTAGPLRLVLMCDGEQVHSVQVDAGYAYRGMEQAMLAVTWQEALAIARQFDPLAPIAGQLAYVRALEQLQGWQPPEAVALLREAALALERVQNTLWWLVRFAQLLADAPLFDRAFHLAANLASHTANLWESSPSTWIYPQQIVSRQVMKQTNGTAWRALAEHLAHLQRYVEHARTLAIRTRGIGVLTSERLEAAGVRSGPNFQASAPGRGDVLSRLLARLQIATRDLLLVRDALDKGETARAHAPVWGVPEGDTHATVEGPRGTIGLHLVGQGGRGPMQVAWQRPSALLLQLLPDLLRGQKLTDAEVILASLDLAMAEADG
jgi:NADH-quinone oxidoreductase subunit D